MRDGAAGAIGRRTLVRETLLVSAPAAVAAFLAGARLRELEAIAARIESLPLDQDRPAPGEAEGVLSRRLLRPVSELGRQLRRQTGRMQMLRSVIGALPDPIMVVDQEMRVVQANATARGSFTGPGRRSRSRACCATRACSPP